MAAMLLMAGLPPLPREERQPDPKEPPEPKPLPLLAGTDREEDAPQLKMPPLPDRWAKLNSDSYPVRLEPRPLAMAVMEPEERAQVVQTEQTVILRGPLAMALPHQHSTVAHSKLCRECGQKLSGAELREIRERQAKAAGKHKWTSRSPWEQAGYDLRRREAELQSDMDRVFQKLD